MSLEKTWLKPSDYAKYSTVIIVGSLPRAGIEPNRYSTDDLKHVHKFLNSGGTLWLMRGNSWVFRDPEGQHFLAEITDSSVRRKEGFRVLAPKHRWLRHLKNPLKASWVSPGRAKAIRASKGELVVGNEAGLATLYRVDVGKGQLVYVGWEISASAAAWPQAIDCQDGDELRGADAASGKHRRESDSCSETMTSRYHYSMKILSLALALVFLLLASTSEAAEPRPNVLLIAIDDLNDWVGCLGGHPNGHSPNIDRLARRGTLFTNAHCQAPICNPSRTSIMYGLRPSTTGIYMNAPKPWTVEALKDRVTMPRHFSANGYRTFTTGKIYHGSGLPQGDFDVVGPRPGQRIKHDARLIPPSKEGAKGLWDFGGQSYDEKLFQDYADASWGIDVINRQGEEAKPFFLAVGFYRPHVPFYAPSRIFRDIPIETVDLPPVRDDDRDDIPKIAWDLTKAPAAPPHDWFVTSGNWRKAVQSYLACIRWTDEQVGRLLDALDTSPHGKNTIVVLYSDHGFFLGEKQRWAKQSLWERATRVPFIISTPGLPRGAKCSRPTELLSIYPTLIDLCGIERRDDLEGVSLRLLLENSMAKWPHLALTTHGRNNHAVRDDSLRYIRYQDGTEELYDLPQDPNEWTNLAADPQFARRKAELAGFFPKRNVEPAKARKPAGKRRPPVRKQN